MSSTILSTSILVLALTSFVNGTPIQKGKNGFSIQQVQATIRMKNGPADIAKTLQKYGQDVPGHIQVAAVNRAAATGTVPANPTDEYDSAYLCPVVVGNTTLRLDFDTGSSDLWVYSSLQNPSELGGHNYYKVDPSKQKQGYTWKIGYEDGSGASGEVFADRVAVGAVTATSQAVEAATSVSASFQDRASVDGLLGLAFSTINQVQPVQQTTFFDTVRSSLDSPLFAVSLKDRAPGTYDFGFIDASKHSTPIVWVNADSSRGYWGFEATGYSVGASTGPITEISINGVVDTGTTLIYVDDSIVKSYYSKIPGAELNQNAGGYIFPCNVTPPDFSIVVGGANQTVQGKYINYSPAYEGAGMCFGGIQSNANAGISIFGDIFLKSTYVVFMNPGSNPRLGFAKQA